MQRLITTRRDIIYVFGVGDALLTRLAPHRTRMELLAASLARRRPVFSAVPSGTLGVKRPPVMQFCTNAGEPANCLPHFVLAFCRSSLRDSDASPVSRELALPDALTSHHTARFTLRRDWRTRISPLRHLPTWRHVRRAWCAHSVMLNGWRTVATHTTRVVVSPVNVRAPRGDGRRSDPTTR